MIKIKFLLSWTITSLSIFSSYSQISEDKQSKIKSVNKVFMVALEICSNNSFNFCSDGYEQPYRIFPYFVIVDTNYMVNYDLGVLTINSKIKLDSINLQGVYFEVNSAIETILNNYSSDENKISIYNQNLKRKVNKYFKSHNLDKKFDGRISFYIFQINVKYYNDGKKSLMVPDISCKFRSPIVHSKEIAFYSILSFEHILPIKDKTILERIKYSRN